MHSPPYGCYRRGGFCSNTFMSEKGQFLTPINVVRFMLWAVQADQIAIKRIK